MVYHDVTVSSCLRLYAPAVADQLDLERAALGRVRDAFAATLADSKFNRAELERFV